MGTVYCLLLVGHGFKRCRHANKGLITNLLDITALIKDKHKNDEPPRYRDKHGKQTKRSRMERYSGATAFHLIVFFTKVKGV
jgi:hypothetical protein